MRDAAQGTDANVFLDPGLNRTELLLLGSGAGLILLAARFANREGIRYLVGCLSLIGGLGLIMSMPVVASNDPYRVCNRAFSGNDRMFDRSVRRRKDLGSTPRRATAY